MSAFDDVHKKLRKIRIDKGLSQKSLGEKCGLTQQAINRIEQGQRRAPSFINLSL
jgi:transcriptional regulator with XRE-family HTH domain